jgi:ubiquinone/menaquinone biosynthesis C-methylase UbiE
MKEEIFSSINSTKKGFEESFGLGSFYNKQTQDQEHLEKILGFLKIQEGFRILDLGTGMGYLAFPIAKKYPNVNVTGLDIVEQALVKNQEKAKDEGLNHLEFISYDGMEFPFENGTFDMVITRYALHHFPEINKTFKEINRVLKPNGKLFISDPAPNDDDSERFVDAYMQMKKDGHIKFYAKDEWQVISHSAGLELMDGFETQIRFPKKKNTAIELEDILNRYDRQVIDGYNLEIIEDEIWITEKINNLLFQKCN